MEQICLYTVKLVKEKETEYNQTVNDSKTAYNLIQKVLDINNSTVEKFGLLTLDTRNKIIGIHILTVGTLNSSIVHPRDVFQHAILSNANSILLFHNHPSGNPTPSLEDETITAKLKEAGELMGIPVIDHVIVGDGGFMSMADDGRL